MRGVSGLFLLLLLVWAPGRAQAICLNLELYNVAATQTFGGNGAGFDPYDTAEYFSTVSFQVRSIVSVLPCTYYVTLRSGQGTVADRRMAYNGVQLKYNAYTNMSKANVLSDDSGSAYANTVYGNFATVLGLFQYNSHSFVWSVAPVQPVPPSGGGYYTDTVYLDVYEGVPGSGVWRNGVAVTFQARVLSSVDMAVVAPGGAFSLGATSRNVDFGDVGSGAQRDFDISVRSNVGYRVTMTSANRQQLVKTAPAVPQTIPYGVTVGGLGQDLSGGEAVNVGQSAPGATTPALGLNLPVVVTLGTIPAAMPAGTYQDALSLSVSSY